MGIPTIKIGPRGRRIGPRNEEIEIDVMFNAAKLYALITLDICTRTRSQRKLDFRAELKIARS